MSISDCRRFLSEKIAGIAAEAWKNRKPGGISFGLGHAVVGHNRLAVDHSGKSVMYAKFDTTEFSHFEGYEDHSVNLLYTWDTGKRLTGVMVNLASPSQVSEGSRLISADFWHETRLEVRKQLGDGVFILPQCSAAGDLSPHLLVGKVAETRMQRIMGLDSGEAGGRRVQRRRQIAISIADAVTSVFQYMSDHIDWDPEFEHRMGRVPLTRRLLGKEDALQAREEAEHWKKRYSAMLAKIEENPEKKLEPYWFEDITVAYKRMQRGYEVVRRYELQATQPRVPIEVHVLRIGDIAIATNPFELYLDYGIRIKMRSPAVQTFVVQLSGSGSYLPPARSVEGGSYGSRPASTIFGPKGGQELVEKTLELIDALWQRPGN